ncbi:MAG: hypothetical protein methR_P1725 [Methyloprofundus sp.]|nr:MAG: hypothetical protein methR_P1725 [Methyloprofundus sp.]
MNNKAALLPQIDRLESKLFFSYGIVLFSVLLILSIFSAYHFKNSIEKDEQRLALLTGEILHKAIEQTNFSGKYHSRLFIENIAKTYPDITSIKVFNLNGKIIAHSNPKLNNNQVEEALLNKTKKITTGELHHITEVGKAREINVINVYLPFHKGYAQNISGIIHIVISRESGEQSQKTGLIALILLLSILTLLGLLVLKQISRYLSAPIISMAKVLGGILEHIPMLVMVQNKKGQQLYKSNQFSHYFSNTDAGPSTTATDIFQSFAQAPHSQSIEKNMEFQYLGKDISFRSIHFPISLDHTGNPELVCCIAEDITQKLANEKQLLTNERQLVQVLKGASLGYWDWNYQTGEHFVDNIWLEMLGLTQNNITNHISDWNDLVNADDKKRILPEIERAISTKTPYSVEFRMRHKNGTWIWIQGSGAVVEWDKEGLPLRLCGTHQNISKRKQDEKDLTFLANYDALTRLPNRNLIFEELNMLLGKRRNKHPITAFMFIDLDNFKIINDTYGHKFGDLFLVSVVSKLKKVIRSNDILGRFGGDEFVLIADEIDTLESLTHIAAKVLNSFEKPITLQGNIVYTSVSIGISVFPQDGDNFDDLLKYADVAMYKAKETGKNRFCFYTEAMNQEIQSHLEIAAKLWDAIENNLLELVYQPQVNNKTGAINSCEALLRWPDAEKGYMSPAIFIPIAEKSNLIMAIDEWVMEHACRQRFKWQAMGLNNFRIDINLSGRQFNDQELIPKIQKYLNDYQLQATDIGLELTEGMLIEGDAHGDATVHQLRDLGFEIALDDFGTGYSSLSYLKKFPISTLKIDRSFIVDAPVNPDGAALVNAIIAMAEALSLSVVAEGVETEAQYQFIKNTPCTTIQGYYFHKPMPAAEIENILFKKSLS